MPEGHTIHRIARDHRKLLVGAGPIEVSSPQGRFALDAAVVDGRELLRIEAYGKHLFYGWSNGRPSGTCTSGCSASSACTSATTRPR